MSVITYKRGDKTALTKNFSRYEFDCPCGCGTQMVDPELAEKLQRIRDVVGKKISVISNGLIWVVLLWITSTLQMQSSGTWMFIFDNVSNKQEKNTPKDHACQGICYTFVEKYNFPKELYIRYVEQKERERSSLSAFPSRNK